MNWSAVVTAWLVSLGSIFLVESIPTSRKNRLTKNIHGVTSNAPAFCENEVVCGPLISELESDLSGKRRD
jgi:hypothetical protein